MKTVGKRSLFLYLIAAGFLVGMLWFLIRLILNGSDWVSQPYNGYLMSGESYTVAGDILDRNGETLATSKEGARTYALDDLTRKAVLHTVGDTDGYISTSIQQLYRSELSGYNFFTGLASPTGTSSGNTVTLTIDSTLCQTAYELLGGKKGAVFLYNYKTGETLCKVSAPSFDPENVPEDLESNDYYDGAYLDRTLSSAFTPGSIFKVVTTACAIENLPDWETEEYTCSGSVVIGDNEITCLGEHGTIGIAEGLKVSCNVVFAELAVQLGAEKMSETAKELGFNSALTFDGIDLAESVYQVERAKSNELAWSGIGQYTDLVNPCHMAMLMGAIANDGTPVEPYVVKKITNTIGIPVKSGATKKLSPFLDRQTARTLQTLLRANVEEYYGDDLFPGMDVCAKTGTAQVGEGREDTAWMIGFSENNDTPYAFAVVVEEGGFGISAAAPIASALMQALAEAAAS